MHTTLCTLIIIHDGIGQAVLSRGHAFAYSLSQVHVLQTQVYSTYEV